MRLRVRFLNTKYGFLRQPCEPIFDTRSINTLLGKFTKNGKKETALRAFFAGLQERKVYELRPTVSFRYHFFSSMRHLARPMYLLLMRKARQFLPVPMPFRRSKRTPVALQIFSVGVKGREEYTFHLRFVSELVATLAWSIFSVSVRKFCDELLRTHENECWVDKRRFGFKVPYLVR